MARYIDAEKAEKDGWSASRIYPYDAKTNVYETKKMTDFPTADVVDVVRCKECRYLVRSEGVCKVLSNNYEPPVYVGGDDFCSRGERREDVYAN